jgi:hypothetical protein
MELSDRLSQVGFGFRKTAPLLVKLCASISDVDTTANQNISNLLQIKHARHTITAGKIHCRLINALLTMPKMSTTSRCDVLKPMHHFAPALQQQDRQQLNSRLIFHVAINTVINTCVVKQAICTSSSRFGASVCYHHRYDWQAGCGSPGFPDN